MMTSLAGASYGHIGPSMAPELLLDARVTLDIDSH